MNYRIVPGLPLTAEVRRIAQAQIAEAVAILEDGREKRDGNVHEARKRFKRLRGLYRLVSAFDRDFCRREEHHIGDIAKNLSAARDATAIVETIDRFAAEAATPTEIDRLMTIRRGLVARRDRIVAKQEALVRGVDDAIEDLKTSARTLDGIVFEGGPAEAAEILDAGVEKTCLRAAKALHKAKTHGGEDDFHDLRKSVKYHEMHMRLLRDAWPRPYKSRLTLAGRLGDRLGELHDIPVLRHTVEEAGIGGHAERKFLKKILGRKERTLAADCLEVASRLLATPSATLGRDVAALYLEAADADIIAAS